MSRRAAVTTLVVLIVLGLGGAFLAIQGRDRGPVAIVPRDPSPFRGGSLPPGLAGKRAPDFRLADARGGTLDTRDLSGRPYLVTFLFTDCRDVCPAIGATIRRALEQLGDRGDDVTALAVSVDPEGDSPRAVKRWLELLDLPSNFHYLVGSRERLEPVWRDYFVAPQPNGEAESLHTASIWLMDSAGRLRTKFSAGAPVLPADLAHDLRLLVDDAAAVRGAPDRPGLPRASLLR